MALVKMYWHRYPDGHPSLLRMETWVLWTKTKRDDVRGRKVMQNSTFVYVGRREVGEGADKRMAGHWVVLKP